MLSQNFLELIFVIETKTFPFFFFFKLKEQNSLQWSYGSQPGLHIRFIQGALKNIPIPRITEIGAQASGFLKTPR